MAPNTTFMLWADKGRSGESGHQLCRNFRMAFATRSFRCLALGACLVCGCRLAPTAEGKARTEDVTTCATRQLAGCLFFAAAAFKKTTFPTRNQNRIGELNAANASGVAVHEILVLIVEDDALILLEIEAALQDGGYSSHSEASGEGAIDKLETEPSVRALITDINLQRETSGWDVARRARELFPDLPVIYVTSVAAEEWTSQGVPKSVLISKPFAPAQITTAISQLLNEGNAPSAASPT